MIIVGNRVSIHIHYKRRNRPNSGEAFFFKKQATWHGVQLVKREG